MAGLFGGGLLIKQLHEERLSFMLATAFGDRDSNARVDFFGIHQDFEGGKSR